MGHDLTPAEYEKRGASLHANAIFDNILAISSLRHAGMDCRHLGPQDASEQIHVNLGPGSPCRDDEYCSVYVTHTNLITIVLHPNQIFEGEHEMGRV